MKGSWEPAMNIVREVILHTMSLRTAEFFKLKKLFRNLKKEIMHKLKKSNFEFVFDYHISIKHLLQHLSGKRPFGDP
jgi:hypothetical protein